MVRYCRFNLKQRYDINRNLLHNTNHTQQCGDFLRAQYYFYHPKLSLCENVLKSKQLLKLEQPAQLMTNQNSLSTYSIYNEDGCQKGLMVNAYLIFVSSSTMVDKNCRHTQQCQGIQSDLFNFNKPIMCLE